MTAYDDYLPARLYLGRDWETAAAQGPRNFRAAAHAIRFAMEEAAPVSLRGARLTVGNHSYSGEAIKRFYWRSAYPLPRKGTSQRQAAGN